MATGAYHCCFSALRVMSYAHAARRGAKPNRAAAGPYATGGSVRKGELETRLNGKTLWFVVSSCPFLTEPPFKGAAPSPRRSFARLQTARAENRRKRVVLRARRTRPKCRHTNFRRLTAVRARHPDCVCTLARVDQRYTTRHDLGERLFSCRMFFVPDLLSPYYQIPDRWTLIQAKRTVTDTCFAMA
jgi:hypothetical protein